MHVLGTAGHVDHGKSTLVKALTGIDPDRLPEEKARGLTIELGFAWFETQTGPLGVVDVPGHERFVRTMVAGAGGIDMVLLVVAADDGWMPQTQEHLEILKLLDVRAGIMVLSKCDLVEPSWLKLVEEDLRAKTAGTFLEGAPIVRTDALHGTGIEELKRALAELQRSTQRRADKQRPRLSVDRVFSMAGQGTVVTGTLRDGSFTRGQKVYLFPTNKEVRLRSLQTHKQELESVPPGSRVAANLAGAEKDDVHRGMWLYGEPPYAMPQFAGVELHCVSQLPLPLKEGAQVLLISGTTEVTARLHLPTSRPLSGGDTSVAQLELLEDLAARFGDRFILRLPSPPMTVAGGRVLEPSPHRYGKRHSSRWPGLARLADGDFSEFICFRLAVEPLLSGSSVFPFYSGSRIEFECLLSTGEKTGLWDVQGERLVQAGWLPEFAQSIAREVKAFHEKRPAQMGPLSAELLASIPEEMHPGFLRQLESLGVRAEGPYLCHTSHRAGLTQAQQALADLWGTSFDNAPFAGPTRADLLSTSGEARATLDFLLKSGEFTELKEGVLIRTVDFNRAALLAVALAKSQGEVTVAAFRDAIGATRKYALPLLDRFDRLGYTKRVGESRVLGPRAGDLDGTAPA